MDIFGLLRDHNTCLATEGVLWKINNYSVKTAPYLQIEVRYTPKMK